MRWNLRYPRPPSLGSGAGPLELKSGLGSLALRTWSLNLAKPVPFSASFLQLDVVWPLLHEIVKDALRLCVWTMTQHNCVWLTPRSAGTKDDAAQSPGHDHSAAVLV